MKESKSCIFCIKTFYRNKKYSNKQWEASFYCGRSCRSRDIAQKRAPIIMSDATKAKISKANKGKTKVFSQKHKDNIKKYFTKDIKADISARHIGEGNPNWRGGKTPQLLALRMTAKYKEWRTNVFKRDKFTCVHCGNSSRYLNADHILPFATFPEQRFEVSNGRTLCVPCHKETPTYGSSKKRQVLQINT